jgi:hypothetical protein
LGAFFKSIRSTKPQIFSSQPGHLSDLIDKFNSHVVYRLVFGPVLDEQVNYMINYFLIKIGQYLIPQK